MIIEYIRYEIDAGRASGFEEAYAAAGEILQQSPHCLSYELSRGEEEPQNYILRIEWTSTEDHLNGFRKSSEFPEFFRLVKPYFEDIREMKHYAQTSVRFER